MGCPIKRTLFFTASLSVCVCKREADREIGKERDREIEKESQGERKGERQKEIEKEGEKEYVMMSVYVFVCVLCRALLSYP